jgi:hypothetical protein
MNGDRCLEMKELVGDSKFGAITDGPNFSNFRPVSAAGMGLNIILNE